MSLSKPRRRPNDHSEKRLLDPIKAAIKRFRKADKESRRVHRRHGLGAKLEKASSDVRAARFDLAETAPTTLAGLAVYARFLNRSTLPDDGTLFDGAEEHLAFYASLDRSLSALKHRRRSRS